MITRRALAASVGACAALSPIASAAAAKQRDLSFPPDFRWGCATAAYQIEGAVKKDGRGESIWDQFSHAAGKIADGQTGDIACDSYHRYREDTQLLKGIGANAYRFSIAWPRIFPDGRGKPNQKGVDHYKRVVDDLLQNGVEPYVTLFHWDLPSALSGGWLSRDTAYAFADYAGYMAGQLSDRVQHFMTTNEMRSFIDVGHYLGTQAPGLHLQPAELYQVRHHAVLAHGLGLQAIRAKARSTTQVGLAENPTIPVPVIESPEHIAAATKAMRASNAGYLTAVMEGRYTDEYLQKAGADAPKAQAGDMRAIGSPLDFVALNVYAPTYVRADASPAGFAQVLPPRSYPQMMLPWLAVGPESLYWAARLTSEVWRPKSILISENGCASADTIKDGRIDDTDRVMFLRNYLTHLQRATAEGYPVKGYFAWTLMDNFEWAEGLSKRFGLYYTDFATQQRTPKLSAAWFRELTRRNALV